MRGDHAQVRDLTQQVHQPLRRGIIVAVVAHVEQHRKPAPCDGPVGLDAGRVVDGQLLEVRMDLQSAQPKRHDAVQLLLEAVHARIDRAEADERRVRSRRRGQKRIHVMHLMRRDGGIADNAAADPGLLLLAQQVFHARGAIGRCAVKIPDGMRGLVRQFVRKDVRVNVCDLHSLSPLKAPHSA